MTKGSAFSLTLGLGLLAGCGGGGGTSSGSIEPLSVPSQMTVIAAQDSQTGSVRITPERWLGARPPAKGALPAGATDYANDATRIYVHDDSMDVLSTINGILTMLGQTGYSDPDVLNAGPYVALVEDAVSDNKGSDPTNGGQSSEGSEQIRLMEWTVRSDRESADAPHIVQFWIDWEEDGDGQNAGQSRIYGKLTITEAPSDSAPYGRFTLNFKMLGRDDAPDAAPRFQGTLSTVARDDGQAEYTFVQTEGDVAQTPPPNHRYSLTRARVLTNAAGTSGTAFSAENSKWNDGTSVSVESYAYHIAFNQRYMARRLVQGSESLEAFDRQSFRTYPWRYGLYDSTTEARVNLQSGFGIKTADGVRGFAGYHGIWLPESVTVTNGMPVTRDSHGQSGTPQSYTVFVAAGRLEKRTRTNSTLGNLKNENLYTWDSVNQQSITVRWTGTDLVKIAYFNRITNQWVDLDSPVSILGSFTTNQWVGLQSPARGEINFTWPSGTPSDSTPVAIWAVETITRDSSELAGGDLTLYGYFQMLRANLTQAQVGWTGGQSPYFPDAADVGQGKTYVFAKTSLLLTLAGENVTPGVGVTLTGTPSAGGLMSGSLVVAPLGALSEMSDQLVTYRWQTGAQQWNQLRTLVDANSAFVAFDQPLAFLYTHDEPSSTRWHGKTFRLEYQGHGQLHGIPAELVAGTDRWYPVVAIPSGTLLSNDTGAYKVKVLEAEQKMNTVSNAQELIDQEGLDVMTGLTPPTDSYEDPAIGTKPSVSDAPLFVRGVKQS